MKTEGNNCPTNRLQSLDILRGLDLFLLVFLQPTVVAIAQQMDIPLGHFLLTQLDHEVWEGFRFWDLIMPLFLFMTGVAMPFSMQKYTNSHSKSTVYKKIIKRFIILFVIGMVVQGNLLGLNPNRIYLYTNTLQAIAVGYLISAIILIHCKVKYQILFTIILLLVYSIPMIVVGNYTPEHNFAEMLDRNVLGRFRDGSYLNESGEWCFAAGYHYTWIWSSLTFGVTVMSGVFAGEIMKNSKQKSRKTVIILLSVGVGMVILGLLWSGIMPIIKRIWTGSMVLLSSGYCFLLMGIFYYFIDVLGCSKGFNWLKIYGMNSIVAYVLGEIVNFRSVVNSLSYGLEQYFGNYYNIWLTFGNFLILFFILKVMYRHKIFVKI